MPDKSPIHKLQDTIVEAVSGVVADPAGAASKAAGQVRGVLSLGLTVAGQVAEQLAERINSIGSSEPERPAPGLRPVPDAAEEEKGAPSPADVARAVEKNPADVRRPPAKKAAKKTPSAKLPVKKAPVKKAPAKKAPAKKAPAKKAPPKKAAPKAAARKTAAEVLDDTSATTPVGTTGADVGTNPDTTDTDLQQVGTEPIMDPATTKAVAGESEVGARGSDVEKG